MGPLILLVDVSLDARDMYCEYLPVQGYRCVAVADGASAIEHAINEAPEVILLDMRMAGMTAAKRCEPCERTLRYRTCPSWR